MLILVPGHASLTQLEEVWRSQCAVRIDPLAQTHVDAASKLVASAAAGEEAVYGVNTGFGKLASVKIASRDTATLQRNLILSHCCGVGDVLDIATARLMMVFETAVPRPRRVRCALGNHANDRIYVEAFDHPGCAPTGFGGGIR